MRFFGVGSHFAALLYCASAASQSATPPGEGCSPQMRMEPAQTSDAEILVELVGIPNVSNLNAQRLHIRQVLNLGTACSLPEAGGYATIAYDPVWAAGDTPAFYLTLGHEAGHHFCGHYLSSAGFWGPQQELEADQFAGASIKRFEVYHGRSFFSQAIAVAAARYAEQASFPYPPRQLRIEAIRRGYEQGSPCGGLAPVEQAGFSPPARSNGPPTPCRPVRTGPTSYACR
jgi:hypothetical protein